MRKWSRSCGLRTPQEAEPGTIGEAWSISSLGSASATRPSRSIRTRARFEMPEGPRARTSRYPGAASASTWTFKVTPLSLSFSAGLTSTTRTPSPEMSHSAAEARLTPETSPLGRRPEGRRRRDGSRRSSGDSPSRAGAAFGAGACPRDEDGGDGEHGGRDGRRSRGEAWRGASAGARGQLSLPGYPGRRESATKFFGASRSTGTHSLGWRPGQSERMKE